MRKTRASQASSSEKLIRLQSELLTAYEMANSVLLREKLKREASQQARAVWERREDLVNMKRRFLSLGSKEDEELFYDKERVPKKPKVVEAPTTYVYYYSYAYFRILISGRDLQAHRTEAEDKREWRRGLAYYSCRDHSTEGACRHDSKQYRAGIVAHSGTRSPLGGWR